MHVPIDDYGNTDLIPIFQQCFDFIRHATTQSEGVLVYCRKGINRSCSTVIAFLMNEYNWTLRASYDLVRAQRRQCSPHEKVS